MHYIVTEYPNCQRFGFWRKLMHVCRLV